MVVNGISFRQSAVIGFTVTENNSAADIYGRLRYVYGDSCMDSGSIRR